MLAVTRETLACAPAVLVGLILAVHPMTRCGGWLTDVGIDAVHKWKPGKPIRVWATGRPDYVAALDGILKQISDLMNHTFVLAESREQSDLIVGLGISSFPDNCIGGAGCGRAFEEEGDQNTAVRGVAYVIDHGDEIPRGVITHELMHALIPQGHYPMAYHTVREIQNLSASDEAILRLHAHPLVRPGMTVEELEETIVFRDELLDASPLEVNTLVWRAREALTQAGSATFNARGTCAEGISGCQAHAIQEFDWTRYEIGVFNLPGNHFQHLSLQEGALEAYVAGKEFWVDSLSHWRSMDWQAFSDITHWRPNYTSLHTILENILLLGHEGDLSATQVPGGKIVIETHPDRGLLLYSTLIMHISITMDSTNYRVSDYTVTICRFRQQNACIFSMEARDGVYGEELNIPEAIRQSTPTPVPWEGLGITTTLSTGSLHTCALRNDGTPVCWGITSEEQVPMPSEERFASISSRGEYTCGLRHDGRVICWGGDSGVFGEDSHWKSRDGLWTSPSEANREDGYFSKSLPILRFTSLSAGLFTACGLHANGSPLCWGVDGYAPSEEQLTAISVGEGHVCALREDGSPICWGDNESGQASPPSGERFTVISSGVQCSCGLRHDGTPVCWGRNGLSAPENERFTSISTGHRGACGLRADGSAVCWGDSPSPPSHERFVAISSSEHVCALRFDGSAVCWGRSDYGQSSPPENEQFAANRISE